MTKDEARGAARDVIREGLAGNNVDFSRESPRDAARMGIELGFDAGWDAQQAEIERLRTALKNLTEAVTEMIEDSRGVYALASVHGCRYIGREVSQELVAARVALKEAE